MNQEAQQKIVSYFIEEAREHLNTIEQSLLSLQSNIHDSELINELFRAAHSIKGGAAMLGFTSIQRVSHRMEDFFKIFRERTVPVDQHLETLLLRGFDTLSMLLEHVETQTLTDEIGSAALAEIEPVFQETETHIYQLLDEIPKAVPQAKPSLATVMNQQVPTLLKQMVEAVKQSGDVRPALLSICDRLAALANDYTIPGWDNLIGVVKQAIQKGSDLRNVILVVVRTLKQASQDAANGQPVQVSEDLRQLLTPAVSGDPQQASLQEMDRILRGMLDAFKANATTARSKWQQSLVNLRQLGSLHQWSRWVNLVEVVEHIVNDTAQDLATIVRPILKDLKQAHRFLVSGEDHAITPSEELLAFVPLPAVTDSFFTVEDDQGTDQISEMTASSSDALSWQTEATAVHRLTDFLSPESSSEAALEPSPVLSGTTPFEEGDPGQMMTDLLTTDWQDPDPSRYEVGAETGSEVPPDLVTDTGSGDGVVGEVDPWSLLPIPDFEGAVSVTEEAVPDPVVEEVAAPVEDTFQVFPEATAESDVSDMSETSGGYEPALARDVISEISLVIPTPLELNSEDETAFENLFQNAEALADVEDQPFDFPPVMDEEAQAPEAAAGEADLAALFGDVMAEAGESVSDEDGMDDFLSQLTEAAAVDSAEATLAERFSQEGGAGDADLGAMFEDLAALEETSPELPVDLQPLDFEGLSKADQFFVGSEWQASLSPAVDEQEELPALSFGSDLFAADEGTVEGEVGLPALSFATEESLFASDEGTAEGDADLSALDFGTGELFAAAEEVTAEGDADLSALHFGVEDLFPGENQLEQGIPSWLTGTDEEQDLNELFNLGSETMAVGENEQSSSAIDLELNEETQGLGSSPLVMSDLAEEPENLGELTLDELFVPEPGESSPLSAFTLGEDSLSFGDPQAWEAVTAGTTSSETEKSEGAEPEDLGTLGQWLDDNDEDASQDNPEASLSDLSVLNLFGDVQEDTSTSLEDLSLSGFDDLEAGEGEDISLESLGSLFDNIEENREAPVPEEDLFQGNGWGVTSTEGAEPSLGSLFAEEPQSEEEAWTAEMADGSEGLADLGAFLEGAESAPPSESQADDFSQVTDFSHLFGNEESSIQMQEAFAELAAEEHQLEGAALGSELGDALAGLFEDAESVAPAGGENPTLEGLDDLFGDAGLNVPSPVTPPSEDDLDSLFTEETPGIPVGSDNLEGLEGLEDLFTDSEPSAPPVSHQDLDDLNDLFADTPAPAAQDDWSDLEQELAQPSVSTGSLDDLAALFDEPAAPPAAVDPMAELDRILQPAPVPPPVQKKPELVAPVAKVRPSAKSTTTRKSVVSAATMKVEVKHLDFLNNLVGELVVNRNSLGQNQNRLRQFLENLLLRVQQLGELGQRMQDVYDRSLLEIALVSGRGTGRSGQGIGLSLGQRSGQTVTQGLEALEMDQFTAFHSLSQEIIELIVRVRESASDIQFVVDEVEQNARQFGQITTQLQEGLNRARMVPFSQIADRLPRAVRELSIKTGKQVNLVVEGRETLIDKAILEELYDPLTHLVNNALIHGIELPEQRRKAGKSPDGKITVKTFYQGNQTMIVVSDDGGGIPVEKVRKKAIAKGLISPNAELDEIYNVLFKPGFSGRDESEIDEWGGRGVGLDVVRSNINELRGTIQVDSTPGQGTTFTIRLPLTLSISKSMLCISDKALIAFPLDGVEEMMDVPKEEIEMDDKGRPTVQCSVGRLPFRPLSELLTYNRSHSRARSEVYSMAQDEGIIPIVVIQSGGHYAAIQVDNFVEEQEIVIKQLRGPAPKPLGIAGATVQGNGKVLPIADIIELVDLAYGRIRPKVVWEGDQDVEVMEGDRQPTVLIVDDSITVRAMLSMTFTKAGYRVEQARDGQDAWEKLRGGLPCDLVFCDIEMPRMDGLELLARMRDDEYLKNLPIAMLTSRGADKHRQIAKERGANAYFTKPYLEEELLTAAQQLMEGQVLMPA